MHINLFTFDIFLSTLCILLALFNMANFFYFWRISLTSNIVDGNLRQLCLWPINRYSVILTKKTVNMQSCRMYISVIPYIRGIYLSMRVIQ